MQWRLCTKLTNSSTTGLLGNYTAISNLYSEALQITIPGIIWRCSRIWYDTRQNFNMYKLLLIVFMNKINELETQRSLHEVTEHFEEDLRIKTFCNPMKWLLCFKLINLVVHGNILPGDRIWIYLHPQPANCPGHTLSCTALHGMKVGRNTTNTCRASLHWLLK